MTGTRAPIAVALDLPNLDRATTVAAQVADSVAFLKVGLETYLRDGAAGVADGGAAAGPAQSDQSGGGGGGRTIPRPQTARHP